MNSASQNNSCYVLHSTIKCIVPQIIRTVTLPIFYVFLGSLKASSNSILGFQPNKGLPDCDIHKELEEPHILCTEIIFLREIVNTSVKTQNNLYSQEKQQLWVHKIVLQHL